MKVNSYYCKEAFYEGAIGIVKVTDEYGYFMYGKYRFDSDWLPMKGTSVETILMRGFKPITEEKYAELCILN